MKWELLAAAGAVCPMATPADAQPIVPEAATPVGTWSGTVTRRGKPEPIQLAFTESGQARLLTSAGESQGTWVSTGPSTFDYKIVEVLTDSSTGQEAGSVRISQDAQRDPEQDPDAFTSSGQSQVFDLDGQLVRSVTADVSVTRVSAQPQDG
jgi:hypothetical protein